MVPVWMTFSNQKPIFQGYGYSTICNSKMLQHSYAYNGRTIESRIWSIERRHFFQWPWTTPTPGFKATPFLTLNISETVLYRDIVE